MTREQSITRVLKLISKYNVSEDEKKSIEALVEFARSRREHNGMERQAIETLKKSLDKYRLWHTPDMVPERKSNLLLKITKDNHNNKLYLRGGYNKGKFVVQNEEVNIEGWSYMASMYE